VHTATLTSRAVCMEGVMRHLALSLLADLAGFLLLRTDLQVDDLKCLRQTPKFSQRDARAYGIAQPQIFNAVICEELSAQYGGPSAMRISACT
jgi:hypothetical protein